MRSVCLLTWFTCVAVVLPGRLCAATQAESDSVRYQNYYVAAYADEPIRIDGHLTEWTHTSAVGWSSFNEAYQVSEEEVFRRQLEENIVAMKLRWDMQKLYVAFRVYDSYLHAPDTSAYFETDDAVEFYLSTAEPGDPRYAYMTDREYQFMVNAVNSTRTLRGFATNINKRDGNRDFDWSARIESAVACQGTINNNEDTDRGLTYELAVPWSALGYVPQLGDTLFINGAVGDTEAGERRIPRDWAATRFFSYADRWFPLVLADEANNDQGAKVSSGSSTSSSYVSWVPFVGLLILLAVALGWYVLKERHRRHRVVIKALPKPAQASASAPPTIMYIPTQPPEERTPSEKIDQAIERIKHDYQQPLRLASVAAELGLSERRLQEGLKERTKHTFKSLIIEIRLEECARLLRTTETPIAELCYHVGFTDLSSFRRSFKGKFNQSPRTYRKAYSSTYS